MPRYAIAATYGDSEYRFFFRTDFLSWKKQSKDSKPVCKFSSCKKLSNIIALKHASRSAARMENFKQIWQRMMPKLLHLCPSTRFEESGILISAWFATILIGVITLVYAILQWQKKVSLHWMKVARKAKKESQGKVDACCTSHMGSRVWVPRKTFNLLCLSEVTSATAAFGACGDF